MGGMIAIKTDMTVNKLLLRLGLTVFSKMYAIRTINKRPMIETKVESHRPGFAFWFPLCMAYLHIPIKTIYLIILTYIGYKV